MKLLITQRESVDSHGSPIDSLEASYTLYFAELGAQVRPVPNFLPDPETSLAEEEFDGLVLTGGGSLPPEFYRLPHSDRFQPDRDRTEKALIGLCRKQGKPILGICRGMQLINVALGGTLIQDLPPEQKIFHTSSQGDLVHPVFSPEGSTLNGLYGPVFSVNSAHHQALDQLSDGLEAVAWSESGVVEAVELPGYPLLGVQFHPERMAFGKRRLDTVDGAAIFGWFLDVCRESAAFSQPT